jgi:hypothetical protein
MEEDGCKYVSYNLNAERNHRVGIDHKSCCSVQVSGNEIQNYIHDEITKKIDLPISCLKLCRLTT